LFKSKLLRWGTRGGGDWGVKPPEIEALENALELNPNHPLCQIRKCEVLSQLASEHQFPITRSNDTYHNKEEVVEYLWNKAL
jgi:hypothetical protein